MFMDAKYTYRKIGTSRSIIMTIGGLKRIVDIKGIRRNALIMLSTSPYLGDDEFVLHFCNFVE